MKTGDSFFVEVQQRENGEYFVQFPDAFLEELGYNVGDKIKIIDNKNGSYTIPPAVEGKKK